jgi:hypothetical protein
VSDESEPDHGRLMFEVARVHAQTVLERASFPDFCVWGFSYLRGVDVRELRHIACDAILSVLDDRDSSQ